MLSPSTPHGQNSFADETRVQGKKKSKHDDEAGVADLHRIFLKYAKGDFVNAMQFSSIFRLITGEKGNLYKEMQTFKRSFNLFFPQTSF